MSSDSRSVSEWVEIVSRETSLPIMLQSGVDFLTATGKDEKSYERPFAWLAGYSDACVRSGEKAHKQLRNGFKLFCVGQCAFGRRGSEWMVSMWGPLAHNGWKKVAPYAANITRVDLEVTIRTAFDNSEFVRRAYQEVNATARPGKPLSLTLMDSGPKGATVYLGKRVSSQMGRIYDKGAQSKGDKQFDNSLRFEVEFKKPLSREVAKWLLDEDPNNEGIARLVMGWYQERGLDLSCFGKFMESAIERPVVSSSPAKRLKWLSEQVRPTFQELVQLGFESEVYEALGVLPKPVDPFIGESQKGS